MEDVRQLVRGDEPKPAVEEQQAMIPRRRCREDRDPVRRNDGREPVRRIDIVGDCDVHHASRGVQLGREQPVRPFGLARLGERDGAIGRAKVDAEMGRVQGAPAP